jgi:hypothetical protein
MGRTLGFGLLLTPVFYCVIECIVRDGAGPRHNKRAAEPCALALAESAARG